MDLAAVDAKGHQAEEDGHSDQRSRGRGREELSVLDLTVPQDRQHEDQQGDHKAAHVESYLDLVGRSGPASCPPCGMLRDVAVQDAVVRQVEGSQCLGVVLQKLTLVDEPHLLLLACKIGPGRNKLKSELHCLGHKHDAVSVLEEQKCLVFHQIVRYALFVHNCKQLGCAELLCK